MVHSDSCLQMSLKLVECKSRKKDRGNRGKKKENKDKEREIERKII